MGFHGPQNYCTRCMDMGFHGPLSLDACRLGFHGPLKGIAVDAWTWATMELFHSMHVDGIHGPLKSIAVDAWTWASMDLSK